MRSIFLATAMLCAASSAEAATYTILTGHSDNWFDIPGNTVVSMFVEAPFVPDLTICDHCSIGYYASFSANIYDDANVLLQSTPWTNSAFFNLHTSDKGGGWRPLWIWQLPPSTSRLDVAVDLTIYGLLGPDGGPRTDGDIWLIGDGTITPITPTIASVTAVPLPAGGLLLVAALASVPLLRRASRR